MPAWTPLRFTWGECGAEYIVESTGAVHHHRQGRFRALRGRRQEGCHLRSRQVTTTTPMFVMGVNNDTVHRRHGRRQQRQLHHQLPGSPG